MYKERIKCRMCNKRIYRGGVHLRLGMHYHKKCWRREMKRRD